MMLVGVNGSGKTTTAGKLAKRFSQQGKKVILVAADTFRAAAIEQLKGWAEKTSVELISAERGADPAALVYQSIEKARIQKTDLILIDTAGRLQNRIELMEELAKIVRVIKKLEPEAPHDSLIVLDGTVGQNALSPAQGIFRCGCNNRLDNDQVGWFCSRWCTCCTSRRVWVANTPYWCW